MAIVAKIVTARMRFHNRELARVLPMTAEKAKRDRTVEKIKNDSGMLSPKNCVLVV